MTTADITAVHPPGTAIDTYQPGGGIGQYQGGIVMTPETARALDEQVRRCTEAVLREGTDYGVIPGTNGEKTLWRPGAQKLLQWFRLECIVERVEVERDDDGRKHGITYRAEVGRGLKTATPVILATCEGTADYDESKFYQTAEEVQRKAEYNERKWAAQYRRVADPTKWQNRGEYRADWNALMKRAQKRAIVGAVVDATAAGGIFADREEDESPVAQDGGPGFYEEAIGAALTFTDVKAARGMYVGAAQAHRDGLITRRQQDHIQNTLTQREKLLKKATPVDIEDLARQAGGGTARRETAAAGDDTRNQARDGRQGSGVTARDADENGPDPDTAAAGAAPSRVPQPLPPLPGQDEPPDPTRPAGPAATSAGTGSSTAPAADGPSDHAGVNIEDQPGSVSKAQLTKLHTVLTGLGFGGEDREQKLKITETVIGRGLGAPDAERSSKNLSWTEARKLIDTLDGFGGDRDALIAHMAGREQAGDHDG